MKKTVILFFVVLIFLLGAGFSYGAIPVAERAALIALYNSTNGDQWTNKSGWKTAPLANDGFAMPGTEGNWYGVTVAGNRVTQLIFWANHLSGSIPSQLGTLGNLQSLDLQGNELSGSIPSQLSNLHKINWLYLSRNQLRGNIPSQLGSLTQLSNLSLDDNQLSGSIPVELSNLSKLKTLILSNNQLSGSIPVELSNLTNLTILALYNNQLSGSIPTEIGSLAQLKILGLSSNQLNGAIPPSFGNLTDLEIIGLQYNQLTGNIPSELGNLTHLNSLLLNNNQLSGGIPEELGHLSGLRTLDLSNNQLSGSIPAQINSNSILQVILLSYNRLSGEIPTNFADSTTLKMLDLKYNCLYTTDSTFKSWLDGINLGWEATQCLEKAAPFGEFATPVDNSNVSGSIAITGWALDDYGMESVKIYYTQDNSLIYIGDALFIEGARADVASFYPEYPDNTKAGWGYMLLTHFLPNGGNGTYVLHAIATDKYGKTATLGTKTIIVDNATAVKPFGAIDTPTQGGVVYGDINENWGWALTPQPNKIATNGSTIDVLIDGVKRGHPTYNNYRSDIATLFPSYANSNGAVGYFRFNRRDYSNGLHTIQWTATDNAGNMDGIGSRYFTVQTHAPEQAMDHVEETRHADDLLSLHSDLPPFSRDEFNSLPEDSRRSKRVIKELTPVEIKVSQNHRTIQGYIWSDNQLKKLPIGSTLDKKTGTFSWSPGPGFLGPYTLVFVITDQYGHSFKKSLEIVIEPKFNH